MAQPLTSHCCFCSMQCGMNLVPSEKEPFGLTIKPSPDFPVSTGLLCQKGFNAMEHISHNERILHPLWRENISNSWEKADWKHSLSNIAATFQKIQLKYGKDTV